MAAKLISDQEEEYRTRENHEEDDDDQAAPCPVTATMTNRSDGAPIHPLEIRPPFSIHLVWDQFPALQHRRVTNSEQGDGGKTFCAMPFSKKSCPVAVLEGRFSLARKNQEKAPRSKNFAGLKLVGMARLELATPCPPDKRLKA